MLRTVTKRWLSFLLFLVGLLFLLFPRYAFAIDISYPVSISSSGSVVHSQAVNGAAYLFLPSQVNLSSLSLSSESGTVSISSSQKGTFQQADSVDLSKMGVVDSSGEVPASGIKLWVKVGDNAAEPLVIMQSKGVRSVFVSTEHDRSYVDSSWNHSVSDSGTLTVLAPDSNKVVYSGDLNQIRGRGNTTWSECDKKPYQMKLPKKTDLLGTGEKTKTWLLIANAADPSLLRNTVSFNLARYMGVTSTPSCEPCDLYYNGEYRGSYLLTEKVKVEKNGVNIDNLDDANEDANADSPSWENPRGNLKWGTNARGSKFSYIEGLVDPSDISGGYLVELDDKASEGDDLSQFYSRTHFFTVHTPDGATENEARYVSELVGAGFEAALSGGRDSFTQQSVDQLFDIDSLISTGVTEDFLLDGDYLYSSSYFYVPAKEDRIFLGPIWDCDRAFDQHRVENSSSFADGFLSGNTQLMSAARRLYANKLKPAVEGILLGDKTAVSSDGKLHSIAFYEEQIAASQAMDQALWGLAPLDDPWLSFDRSSGKSWSSYVNDLSSFANQRLAFLDRFYENESWKECSWTGSSMADWAPTVNGKPVQDGWVFDRGDYYLMRNGRFVGGWAYVSGDWYYLDPSTGVMKRGWQFVNGSWYYFKLSGAMYTGWLHDGNDWYYLDDSGAMLSNTVSPDGYWLNGDGTWTDGSWQQDQTGWWYRTSARSYPRNARVFIDGSWYDFDAHGYLRTGWSYDGSNWRYVNPDRSFATGWQWIAGAWYFFDDDGVMQTGWLKRDASWFYLKPSGAMATGWAYVNGSWYFFDVSGAMRTGWLASSGSWYFLLDSGAMATGWVKSADNWYLLNSSGAMQTGWAYSDGCWYCFDDSGAMKTGWVKSGGSWYYLWPNGSMAVGWVSASNDWYYMDSNGAMHQGWLKIGSTWYYFDESGAAVTGNRIIDGVSYRFDSSCALVS